MAIFLLPSQTLGQISKVEIGANYWDQAFEARARKGGDFIDLDSTFDIADQQDWQVYLNLEHDGPRWLPNLHLQHSLIETAGDGVVTHFYGCSGLKLN